MSVSIHPRSNRPEPPKGGEADPDAEREASMRAN
jgi:hypothetical protein